MLEVNFHKYKYGAELLFDCVDLSEIAGKSISNKELHLTTFYEIFFFMDGESAIILEGKRINISSPCILFLRPGLPRQWELSDVYQCKIIFFEGVFIENFLKDHLFLHRLYFFLGDEFSKILPLQKESMNSFVNLLFAVKQELNRLREDSYQLLRAYLFQLLILLNRSYTAHYAISGNLYQNLDMLHFKELLKKYIREKQTVKEYAELLNMNRNRLNLLCHEVFAKDASQVIKTELVESCKYDLLTTDKTIAEVGYGHNFSAPSNFVRFFKSMTKLSPANYRAEFIR